MPIDPKGITRPSGAHVPPDLPPKPASVKASPAERIDAAALGLGVSPEMSREERVRRAEAHQAAARDLLRGHQPDAQAQVKVTPTMPRKPELEDDQTLRWTGTHHQQIGI